MNTSYNLENTLETHLQEILMKIRYKTHIFNYRN